MENQPTAMELDPARLALGMDPRVEHFEARGYVLLGRVLSDLAVETSRAHLARMLAALHPSLGTDEIYSAHQQEAWMLEVACTPALLDAVECALGADIVLWSTHLICKPPCTGRGIPWHQDGTYWNLSGRLASVWLALDDVDDENGTMYVLPGYHKQILGRRGTGDLFFDEEIRPDTLPEDVNQRAVPYLLRAGEAAMHDVLIPHRSPPNRSAERWRRIMVIRYMSADGDMAPKQYPNYRTAEPFDRIYILVRGRDAKSRGLVPMSDFLPALSRQVTL